MEQSTFWLEEPPVNHSASPANGADLAISEETSCSSLQNWLTQPAQSGLFGKTCRAYFRRETAPTSDAYCRLWPDGTYRRPPRAGEVPESCRNVQDTSALPGEYLTLSIPEHNAFRGPFPNDAGVCGLSDILEAGPIPRKYYLSPRACLGILRRAAKRGKALPPALHSVLEVQSKQT